MKECFENIAHIIFYRSGHICFPTNATSIDEFMDGIERIADKYGINISNLRINSIEIKDSNGNILDKRGITQGMKMNKFLDNLEVDELKWLISKFKHDESIISEILVDVSKQHITPEHAIKQIRDALKAINICSSSPDALPYHIKYYMGKISREECRYLLGLDVEGGSDDC